MLSGNVLNGFFYINLLLYSSDCNVTYENYCLVNSAMLITPVTAMIVVKVLSVTISTHFIVQINICSIERPADSQPRLFCLDFYFNIYKSQLHQLNSGKVPFPKIRCTKLRR